MATKLSCRESDLQAWVLQLMGGATQSRHSSSRKRSVQRSTLPPMSEKASATPVSVQVNEQNLSAGCRDATRDLVDNVTMTSLRSPPIDFVELDDFFDQLGANWPAPRRHSLDFSSDDLLALAESFSPVLENCSTLVESPSFLPVNDTSSLERAHPTSKSGSAPKKRKYRSEDITKLRALVRELTQQVRCLKAKASTTSVEDYNKQQSLWGRIAIRQHKLHMKAKEENAALLRMMAAQHHDIKNFKRMFKRRMDEELMCNRLLLRRPEHVCERVDHSSIFADLLKHLEMEYASVDQRFQQKASEMDSSLGRMCQTSLGGSTTGALAEFMDKYIVPFGFEQTERAIWRCLGRRKIPNAKHLYAEDYSQHNDTTTIYVHYVCNGGGTVTYIQEHGVARKIVEDSRTVFASRTTVVPAGKKIGALGGLKYQEDMNIIVRRGPPMASGHESSIVETCLSVHRIDGGTEAAMAFRAPKFLDLAVKGWGAKVSRRKQEIENLLFLDA